MMQKTKNMNPKNEDVPKAADIVTTHPHSPQNLLLMKLYFPSQWL
jgi:hypothetical protein